MKLIWLFHLLLYLPYPNSTRAGTWWLLEVAPVSVIDGVQPSREVIAGQSQMPQSQKRMYPLQVLTKASVNKARMRCYGSLPFLCFACSFPTAGSYCCCLQNYDKIFGDFWVCTPQTVWSTVIFAMKETCGIFFIGSSCFHAAWLCYSW